MKTLSVHPGAVTRIVIDHSPLNLFDLEMQHDLEVALDRVESDSAVRVVVFESAVPGYFIAHYDLEEILVEDAAALRSVEGPFNSLMRRLRASPKPTIGKIRGAARGGGCELLLALDMRFASLERSVFSFPEASLGILAAGGGTQRLPALIGRARALEMLLSSRDIDAAVAERYGLVNRAVPDSELDSFVSELSARVARQPPRSVAMAKLAVRAAVDGLDAGIGFALEALLLDLLKATPESRTLMRHFLEAGGQTPDGERSFESLLGG